MLSLFCMAINDKKKTKIIYVVKKNELSKEMQKKPTNNREKAII